MPAAREERGAASGPAGPPAGTAQVWRLPLDLPAHELAPLEATLDAGERARAARFHFGRDRRRWVAARGDSLRTAERLSRHGLVLQVDEAQGGG